MYSRQDRRENPVRYQVLPAEVSQEASSQSNLALSKRQIKAEFQGQGDTDGPLRVLEQCLPKPTGTPAFVFFDKRPKPNAQRNLDTFTVRACLYVRVRVFAHTHVCTQAMVEVRGQAVGSVLSVYHVGPRDHIQSSVLEQVTFLMSPPASPQVSLTE